MCKSQQFQVNNLLAAKTLQLKQQNSEAANKLLLNMQAKLLKQHNDFAASQIAYITTGNTYYE